MYCSTAIEPSDSKLEEELGILLFERGTRPVRTTEAGQFFYQHAVQI